jgi:hypothetical protein
LPIKKYQNFYLIIAVSFLIIIFFIGCEPDNEKDDGIKILSESLCDYSEYYSMNMCALCVEVKNTSSNIKNVIFIYNGFNSSDEGFCYTSITGLVSPNSVTTLKAPWVESGDYYTGASSVDCDEIDRFELDSKDIH